MKALDRMPTDENLDEVAQNDVLERNHFIECFVRMLASIKGHYSIALDGRWGTGKTFFVKQTERVIKLLYNAPSKVEDKKNDILTSKFGALFNDDNIKHCKMIPIYYDAWEHDNQQDALLSLILEIDKNMNGSSSSIIPTKSTAEKTRAALSKALFGIIEHFSGIDLKEITKAVGDENSAVHAVNKLRRTDDLETRILSFFQDIIPEKDTRLIIFIDELDRCRPDYAVQMLERVKHYMLIDCLTLVFSVNTFQLQHTIKHFYGEGFDASLYLDRFFDWRVLLPVPDAFKDREIVKFGSKGSIFNDWCKILSEHFNFSIRERLHFYDAIQNNIKIHDYFFSIGGLMRYPKRVATFFSRFLFCPFGISIAHTRYKSIL